MKTIATAAAVLFISGAAMAGEIFDSHATYGTVLNDVSRPAATGALSAQPAVGDSMSMSPNSAGEQGRAIFDSHETYGTVLSNI